MASTSALASNIVRWFWVSLLSLARRVGASISPSARGPRIPNKRMTLNVSVPKIRTGCRTDSRQLPLRRRAAPAAVPPRSRCRVARFERRPPRDRDAVPHARTRHRARREARERETVVKFRSTKYDARRFSREHVLRYISRYIRQNITHVCRPYMHRPCRASTARDVRPPSQARRPSLRTRSGVTRGPVLCGASAGPTAWSAHSESCLPARPLSMDCTAGTAAHSDAAMPVRP